VKSEIGQVPGVSDPGVFNLLGQPNLVVKINRAKAARYGFSVGDINSVVQAAIGGQEVTRVYEGEMNFALTVRLAPDYRRNIDAIRSIPVALPNSDSRQPIAYIALGELGEVKLEAGAAYIYRENNQRFVPIKYSVRGRDLGSTVAEAQQRIAEKVPMPDGYRIEWTGEFGALQEAQKRLAIIVPLSLGLIFMLLYSLFSSVRMSLLALSGIPFAVAGGILGLTVAGLNFSISAAIGFISLFGVSSMDGILLMTYIRKNLDTGIGTDEAIITATQTRMRQILMTGLSACIGPGSGGAFDRDRRAGPAAARLRHRRRHAAVADLQPARDFRRWHAFSCPTCQARLQAARRRRCPDRTRPSRSRRSDSSRVAVSGGLRIKFGEKPRRMSAACHETVPSLL